MTQDVGQDDDGGHVPLAHQVSWFAPDRPTGGTVFVRPSGDDAPADGALPPDRPAE
jgi:hypothetical protein